MLPPQGLSGPTFSVQRVLADAVAASAALVDVSRPVNALSVPHSLCLQTGKSNEFLGALFRRQRMVFLGLLGAGCLLLLVLFGLSRYLAGIPWGAPNRMLLLAAALVCLAAALACFVLAIMGSGGRYRKIVQPRLSELEGAPDLSKPEYVEIEYPAAVASASPAVTSDVGFVVCAPQRRRIIVEGVLLRHIVRAEDVVELQQVEVAEGTATTKIESSSGPASSPSMRLQYRIGGQTTLVIGLQQDSIAADLMRQCFGREGLAKKIRQALAS